MVDFDPIRVVMKVNLTGVTTPLTQLTCIKGNNLSSIESTSRDFFPKMESNRACTKFKFTIKF